MSIITNHVGVIILGASIRSSECMGGTPRL